jgi:hypothetical protein
MSGLGKQIRGTGIAKVINARTGFKDGGSFPDLTGDGKVTKADILKGRGVFKKGGSSKPGLWANINRRKKLGISRPKSKSTISAKAYANMKAGFPKKKK